MANTENDLSNSESCLEQSNKKNNELEPPSNIQPDNNYEDQLKEKATTGGENKQTSAKSDEKVCDEQTDSEASQKPRQTTQHHSGLTQSLGLPLNADDEMSKKYTDVVKGYQELRGQKAKELNTSGITQAFGALLPKNKKSTPFEDAEKVVDEDGWETKKPESASPWDEKT